MQLSNAGLDRYKSTPQRARVCTEPWGQANLYCAACDSQRIISLPTGTHAADFSCPKCLSRYQLKSSSKGFGRRVIDGAYAAMERAIKTDETPNMFFLHYRLPELTVQSVFLIPHFAFSLSCVQKRNALSSTARRSGYVGCYFVLDQIPPDARIAVVENSTPSPVAGVRRAYKRLRPLENLRAEKRGWTLDVLNIVRSLNKPEFSLADVYAHENELGKLHPDNRHVRDKIRQQLQVLRDDFDLLQFINPGRYRLK